MALAIKDPDARIDYIFDWVADYLDAQRIVESSWHIEPVEAGGLVVTAASQAMLRTAVQVSGGRAGSVYRLTNRVMLSDGQVDDRSIAVRVEAR